MQSATIVLAILTVAVPVAGVLVAAHVPVTLDPAASMTPQGARVASTSHSTGLTGGWIADSGVHPCDSNNYGVEVTVATDGSDQVFHVPEGTTTLSMHLDWRSATPTRLTLALTSPHGACTTWTSASTPATSGTFDLSLAPKVAGDWYVTVVPAPAARGVQGTSVGGNWTATVTLST